MFLFDNTKTRANQEFAALANAHEASSRAMRLMRELTNLAASSQGSVALAGLRREIRLEFALYAIERLGIVRGIFLGRDVGPFR